MGTLHNIVRRVRLVLKGVLLFKDWPLWLLARFHLLRKSGVGKFRMRDGSQFLFDFSHNNVGSFQEVWLMGVYEQYYRIRPNDTVVDIGASIGAFSVLAAKRGAQVYAYEPTPRSFELLAKNIKGYSAAAYNLAVADRVGYAELFVAGGDEGNSLIRQQKSAPSLQVQTTTLDAILKKIGHCHFLKIDCEGGEIAILKGTSPETFRCIDHIALEYHKNLSAVLAVFEGKDFDVISRGVGDGSMGYVYATRRMGSK